MASNRKLKAGLLIGGIALASLALTGYFFLEPPKLEPLPKPNGYDDFVAAGEMLNGEIPDWKTVSVEELRQFVSSNQAALDRGRSGLAAECRVPTDYSSPSPNSRVVQITATRQLVKAISAEGKLAELENNSSAAVSSYLNVIKIGAMLVHGGLMIDGLIAINCESMGELYLDSEVQNLNLEQSLKLITELEKVEAQQEPSAEIIKHENLWAKSGLRSFQGIKMYLSEVAETRSFNTAEQTRQRFLVKYDSGLQWLLQLKAKVAAHAYALEKGRSATNWNELVPVYLKSLPNVAFGPDDTNRINFKAGSKTSH